MANLNQDQVAKFLAMENAEQAQKQQVNSTPVDPYEKSKPSSPQKQDLNESVVEYKRMTTQEEAEERLENNIILFSQTQDRFFERKRVLIEYDQDQRFIAMQAELQSKPIQHQAPVYNKPPIQMTLGRGPPIIVLPQKQTQNQEQQKPINQPVQPVIASITPTVIKQVQPTIVAPVRPPPPVSKLGNPPAMQPPVSKQGGPPPIVPPQVIAQSQSKVLIRPAVPIKYPTPKKGDKRVARPPPAPPGGRGPIKAQLSNTKVDKTLTMAEQLAAAAKNLHKVDTTASNTTGQSSMSQQPAKAMTLQEQLLAAQAKMKPVPGAPLKVTQPEPQEKPMTMQEELAKASSNLKPVVSTQQPQQKPTAVQDQLIQNNLKPASPNIPKIQQPVPTPKSNIAPLTQTPKPQITAPKSTTPKFIPRPPVPIKYPTPKKGDKRVARPPPAPPGGRGPIKAQLSNTKVDKTLTMAEQLAAAAKNLHKVDTTASNTSQSSMTTQPAKAMTLQEQLLAAQAKMKPVPGAPPKVAQPEPQEKQMTMQEELAKAGQNLKPVGATQQAANQKVQNSLIQQQQKQVGQATQKPITTPTPKPQITAPKFIPRPPVPIKYPTPKKGDKRVARPPPAPPGGRGPIKAQLSNTKVDKTLTMAEQLAAAAKNLHKVDTTASSTSQSSMSQQPAKAMTLQEQLLAAQAKMKPVPGAPLKVTQPEPQEIQNKPQPPNQLKAPEQKPILTQQAKPIQTQQLKPKEPIITKQQQPKFIPRTPVQIKFATPKVGEKRVARPPPAPSGGRGPIKAQLSNTKVEKTLTMAEQLAAAAKKLQKVETAPAQVANKPMTLQEQLLAAQSKMKSVGVTQKPEPPKQLSFAEQIALANANLKSVPK